MLPRLTLLVAFVAACAVWISGFLVVVQPAEHAKIIQAQGQLALNRMVTVVNSQNSQIERLAEAAAARPGLGRALVDGLPEARRLALESDFTALMPGGLATRLFSVGEAQLEPEENPPITFATLDLIAQVEQGRLPPVESYSDSAPLLRIARPVMLDGEIVGTLLVVLDQGQALQALGSAAELGKIRLVQRFDGAQARTVLALGEGAGTPLTAQTAHPYWRLELTPSPDLAAGLGPDLNQHMGLAVGAILLAGLGGIIANLIMRGQFATDLRRMGQYVAASYRDPNVERPQFNFSLVDKTAVALASKGFNRQIDTPEPPKPEPSPVEDMLATPEPDPLPEAPLDDNASVTPSTPPDEELEALEFPGNLTQPKETVPTMDSTLTAFELPADFTPDADMFRAYDVRGIVENGLDENLAYALGKALASEAADQGQTAVVTGGDGRLSSPALRQALNAGIQSAGVDVIDVGMVPTPLVYYGASKTETQTAVMVTGSHNPKNYNGFKMMIAGTTLAGEEIQSLLTRIQTRNWHDGDGQYRAQDLVETYLAEVSAQIQLSDRPKVVVDAGNGVTGMMAVRFFESIGCETTGLFTDVDGEFPNHHPDPSKPKNLVDLQAAVAEQQADFGFAFDGDGDRVGVITRNGTNVYADVLLMLLAQDVAERNPGATILYDVKCSRHMARIIENAGGTPLMWKTGHSLVKRKMKEVGALLGGEMSGHVFYQEKWYGFDDALYTAARLMEMLARKGRDLDALIDELPRDASTPEINIEVPESEKFKIIERLASQAWFEGGDMSTIDGVRVDYPDGFGLMRASNTTPVLVLRFEGRDAETLARIQNQFKTQILLIAPDLNLPF